MMKLSLVLVFQENLHLDISDLPLACYGIPT